MLLPYKVNGMWVFGQQGPPAAGRAHKGTVVPEDKAWKPNTILVRVSPGGRQAL